MITLNKLRVAMRALLNDDNFTELLPTPETFVADPTGATTDTDVEARAAIVAIRDNLVNLGLMEAEPE